MFEVAKSPIATPNVSLAAPPSPAPLPVPQAPVRVRAATPADLPFIDSLQKRHAKQVGWMPTKALEQKVAAGEVLIAEEETRRHGDTETRSGEEPGPSPCLPVSLSPCLPCPVGYLIASDRYMKREDVGIIYQMNVVPARQRGLIGATLLRAMFERAAYGCKLFCCWCAQDIEANCFWESLGFIPLAFRAGSREKGRVHIFWQRRIRSGDATTPYWFPSRTTSGSIREDRLVFPIPPGVNWRDAMPIVLPRESPKLEARSTEPTRNAKLRIGNAKPARTLGRLQFAPPVEPKAEKPVRRPKPKAKNDPRLVAAARELRDRWLERVNADPAALSSRGKYDVTRAIADERGNSHALPPATVRLLPAAA